jgi:hypothetical protein
MTATSNIFTTPAYPATATSSIGGFGSKLSTASTASKLVAQAVTAPLDAGENYTRRDGSGITYYDPIKTPPSAISLRELAFLIPEIKEFKIERITVLMSGSGSNEQPTYLVTMPKAPETHKAILAFFSPH